MHSAQSCPASTSLTIPCIQWFILHKDTWAAYLGRVVLGVAVRALGSALALHPGTGQEKCQSHEVRSKSHSAVNAGQCCGQTLAEQTWDASCGGTGRLEARSSKIRPAFWPCNQTVCSENYTKALYHTESRSMWRTGGRRLRSRRSPSRCRWQRPPCHRPVKEARTQRVKCDDSSHTVLLQVLVQVFLTCFRSSRADRYPHLGRLTSARHSYGWSWFK